MLKCMIYRADLNLSWGGRMEILRELRKEDEETKVLILSA